MRHLPNIIVTDDAIKCECGRRFVRLKEANYIVEMDYLVAVVLRHVTNRYEHAMHNDAMGRGNAELANAIEALNEQEMLS